MQEVNKDDVEDVGGGRHFPTPEPIDDGLPGWPTPFPEPCWPVRDPFAL